ncbi:MAG: hypothetical protein ACRERE_22540 [Candidatus Entotheonellia bacterium]
MAPLLPGAFLLLVPVVAAVCRGLEVALTEIHWAHTLPAIDATARATACPDLTIAGEQPAGRR